jgi:2-polyprenyl-3-methyl-5-hydroxy-6-metoxy-1,4-benzoquinol methylase
MDPTMNDVETVERQKYELIWKNDDYRKFAPGELYVVPFIQSIRPKRGSTIYDYGTGTGRAALFLHHRGFDVYPLDIAENCMSEDPAKLLGDKLQVVNLFDLPEDMPVKDYGFCTDVMEHIPPEKVDVVLTSISKTCGGCFFNIAFREDHFGQTIGQELHLTVEGFLWWKAKLQEFGTLKQARDLIDQGAFYVEFE